MHQGGGPDTHSEKSYGGILRHWLEEKPVTSVLNSRVLRTVYAVLCRGEILVEE